MIRTVLIPLLALLGVAFGVYTVVQGSKPPSTALPVAEPARAPYASFVAGSGLIEASSQNIAVGTPVPGLVVRVPRSVGDRVARGEALFELDTRELRAELDVRHAAQAAAEANLARLRASPRAEEIPPAQARVAEARASLDDMTTQLATWEKVTDRRAISEDDLSKRRFAVAAAKARLETAEAQLALLKAGAWSADIAVAEADVARAKATVAAAEIEIDRRVIRAPIDGVLLQVNIRAGEFAQAGALQTPLMLLGNVDPLHVRVDVDEHEAWRVRAGAQAMGYLRGNKDIATPLAFVRFEPYVIPKRSLTGESTERVDTRVLQVIYRFDRKELPLFVGQQMDAYIEADALERPAPAQGAAR